jgi:hypothetical protein
LLFCCSIFGPELASQTTLADHSTRRIYVEPFVTQEGSEKFRKDVIAELHKLNSVSLAEDKSSADVILGGGGEIWIKGYRSHNPQLGKVAPNGTPIYTGFLSIELRDRDGQTLWSYLATPRNALAGFLRWMVGPAQPQAAALGYLPIPKDVATQEEAAIARIH